MLEEEMRRELLLPPNHPEELILSGSLSSNLKQCLKVEPQVPISIASYHIKIHKSIVSKYWLFI